MNWQIGDKAHVVANAVGGKRFHFLEVGYVGTIADLFEQEGDLIIEIPDGDVPGVEEFPQSVYPCHISPVPPGELDAE